jgi:hypothetical protein
VIPQADTPYCGMPLASVMLSLLEPGMSFLLYDLSLKHKGSFPHLSIASLAVLLFCQIGTAGSPECLPISL